MFRKFILPSCSKSSSPRRPRQYYLRNVRNYSPSDAISHFRRPESLLFCIPIYLPLNKTALQSFRTPGPRRWTAHRHIPKSRVFSDAAVRVSYLAVEG